MKRAPSLACTVALAAAAWLGCSAATAVRTEAGGADDGPFPSVAAGDADVVPPRALPSDGAPPEAATDASDPPVVGSAGCTLLCNRTMAACSGDHAQFQSKNACLRACAYYPPGALDDYLHDTLACRNAHADAAQTESGHCFHAGAFGIDGCGTTCDGFCQLALGWCGTGAQAPFASDAECHTQCAAFAYAPPRPDGTVLFDATGPTTGGTLDCRMYELIAALEGPAARATHCPLAARNSAACQ